MILYLHGFASCGNSSKTKLLKKRFNNVLSPDIPVDPDEAISLLQKIIVDKNVTLLIGSSLGAYYATYLAKKFQIKTVLLNPSTEPFKTLVPYIGINRFFCSGEKFKWTKEHISKLFTYCTSKDSIKAPMLVLLQEGDEVLDYTKAELFYENYQLLVQKEGNHRFENLDEYLAKIVEFMR